METKEYAKKMLEKYDINVFSQEVEIFKLLNQIIDNKSKKEVKEEELKEIEKRLDCKLKKQRLEELYNFLERLANDLEFQKIRITDQNEEEFRVINFKVIDNKNKEYVFLTRKCLETYINKHKIKFDKPNIVQIESQENIELNMLLDMIIKIFGSKK